jgi:hypothetical protein
MGFFWEFRKSNAALYGNETRRRTIASMDIWNDGTGTIKTGNYIGVIRKDDPPIERRGCVMNYSRLNQPVWSLVGAFLKLFAHTEHPASLMQLDGSSTSDTRRDGTR